jgi:endonuclease/exonuclease/phosphatase family metal-dependent hydrolase
MKAFLKFFLVVYFILSTMVYVLSCLSPFINPEHSSVLYFSGLAFPLILINFVIIALYLGLFKKNFVFLFLIIPGILFGLNYFSINQSDELYGNELVVYTLNAYSGKLFHENKAAFDAWTNYAKAEENQADIICLQEYHLDLVSVLPDPKSYHVFSKEKSNLKIATRLRVVSKGQLKDSSDLRFAIYVDLVRDSDTIRVYNFHLYSNKISAWLETAEEEQSTSPERYIKGGDKLKNRIYSAARQRAMQAKKLRWHMEACPYPIIACGDMNETAQSFAYHQIKGQLKDTFKKGKTGTHPTYRKNPSWVRIDYIFADKEFATKSYEVLPFDISDHRLVKAVIR